MFKEHEIPKREKEWICGRMKKIDPKSNTGAVVDPVPGF